ncbi:MAG: ClpXP protease specificity-enhancing factor SspB [Holosporales bacterium]|jgi:hypothetical protein|nr:ClpXP protease specificity-enhancing factor SspB [Holosporales bacterium]
MTKRIDYEDLLKSASMSVVKEILRQVSRHGLFRKQHLFVTFATTHPNVKMSDILAKEFDGEMTIVLQYEFWDLKVDDFGFSVSLTFEHADETIYVPFASIVSVSDPSEDFSLEFMPDLTNVKKISKPAADKPQSGNVVSIDMFRKKDD